MALDLGTKRIGVAVSDETGTIAQGVSVIERVTDEKALKDIISSADEYKAGKIIVGLPLRMNGTSGERADDCRKFADLLSEKSKRPVELWDERLSTVEAENTMLEADISRAKRKKNIDKLAAQIILQGYLDAQGAKK